MPVPEKIRKEDGFFAEMRRNRSMYLMMTPGILFFLVFAYIPMIGIIIAFQNYNPVLGLFGSKFVGFDNFAFFFLSGQWKSVMINTLFLNTIFIISGMSMAIFLAVMLSEVGSKYYKKIGQTIMTLPHFIAWPIVGMMLYGILATDSGLINTTLKSFGLERVMFYQEPGVWPPILVLSRIWKGAGWSSIIYLAAITSIDSEIYESARIDGASRFKMIMRITLPLLRPIAVLLLIFNIGGMFSVDFGMIYNLVGDSARLYPTTDVIDTFVFRMLRIAGQPGMAGAVGLLQSFLGFIFVLGANTLARKFSPESAIF